MRLLIKISKSDQTRMIFLHFLLSMVSTWKFAHNSLFLSWTKFPCGVHLSNLIVWS